MLTIDHVVVENRESRVVLSDGQHLGGVISVETKTERGGEFISSVTMTVLLMPEKKGDHRP